MRENQSRRTALGVDSANDIRFYANQLFSKRCANA